MLRVSGLSAQKTAPNLNQKCDDANFDQSNSAITYIKQISHKPFELDLFLDEKDTMEQSGETDSIRQY